MATGNASEQMYNTIREAYLHRHPEADLLTHHRAKRLVAELSSVESITHDMCSNSCITYTGPFLELDVCTKCGEPRYNQLNLTASGGKLKIQNPTTRVSYYTNRSPIASALEGP
jgi:hypothetical protein